MSYIGETLHHLLLQTAFMNLSVGNLVMVIVACGFLYLSIAKDYEPLLLLPISFGMLLVNLYPQIMDPGGLLHYFYLLDEWGIFPSLIFMGVGALTDFGPLIANPKSFLLGAALSGIYMAYIGAMLLGFDEMAAAAISIIGAPTGRRQSSLQQARSDGLSWNDCRGGGLVHGACAIIQPPIMKALTTEEERKIKMEQLRPVSKLERILFPIVVTIVICSILPSTTPLVGMLMLGNLFRESCVVDQLTETASNAMMYIVVILLEFRSCNHFRRSVF